jgi:hypothetical protein
MPYEVRLDDSGGEVSPIGSFTDPEYAQVGMTEAKAREKHDVATAIVCFEARPRARSSTAGRGFCKLVVDRATYKILGCHVVGERAVEIIQVAAIAIASGMRVDELAQVHSVPTYAGILGRVAASATRELNLKVSWRASQVENFSVRCSAFVVQPVLRLLIRWEKPQSCFALLQRHRPHPVAASDKLLWN